MSNIDKQWLQQKIAGMEVARDQIPFGLDEDDSNTLAALRIALASLEAEPVAYTDAEELRFPHATSDMWPVPLGHGMDLPLYTAPPSPVSVPDEVTAEDCPAFVKYDVTDADDAWARGFNACRNATLQGAENAESTTTMKTAPALDSSPRIAESPSGINQGKSEPVTTAYKLRDAVEIIRNSGIEIDAEKIFAERDAINAPDCWCRTCRPITLTDMRFVVCPECGNKRCPHANDHRHACTGSNEPGQEGSAYPVAPRQEVK